MHCARRKKGAEQREGPEETAVSNDWCSDLDDLAVPSADQGISVRVNATPGVGGRQRTDRESRHLGEALTSERAALTARLRAALRVDRIAKIGRRADQIACCTREIEHSIFIDVRAAVDPNTTV